MKRLVLRLFVLLLLCISCISSIAMAQEINSGVLYEHYVRSQSMGNREGVRWMSLLDSKNQGVKVISKDNLNFSALHFTDTEIWEAKHDFMLDKIRKPEIYLSLDCIQQGLSNASCGPRPLEKYMIPSNKPMNYSFRIEPVK